MHASVMKAKLRKGELNEACNWLSKSALSPLCFTEVEVSDEEYYLIR